MHLTQDAASIAGLQDRGVAIFTQNHRSSNQTYVPDVPEFLPITSEPSLDFFRRVPIATGVMRASLQSLRLTTTHDL